MGTLFSITPSWNIFQRALIYMAAAALSALSFRWLYLYILTDYRSHHRPIIIPLALVTLVLAFSLFRLSSVAVIFLLILAAVVGAGALYIQIYGNMLHPFLAPVVAVSLLYWFILVPGFIKRA